jgi:hypothetical protein
MRFIRHDTYVGTALAVAATVNLFTIPDLRRESRPSGREGIRF